MAVTQLFVMPLFFICGAIFPVSGLPGWLAVLNRIDPLTYAVDPMRHAVFEHLDVNEVARRALDAGVTWGGWRVPALLEAAIVLAIGLVMLGVAVVEFNRTE
jgi:ABC-2 type transport system permease protein